MTVGTSKVSRGKKTADLLGQNYSYLLPELEMSNFAKHSRLKVIPISRLSIECTAYQCRLTENIKMQIETCDGILASMEEMLGRFQGDLGNISTEIRSLQEQSQNMSVKLKNRKAAEQKLGTFLDSLAITGPLIEGIVQREVDEDYQVLILSGANKLARP